MNEKELIDADFCITDIHEAYYTNITKLNWEKKNTHTLFYSLFLVIEGSAEYTINARKYRVDKETIFLLKDGEIWSGKGIDNGTDTHWRFIEISFRADKDSILKLMPDIFNNINLKHYIPMFKEIVNLSYLNGPLCHIRKKVLLYNIISSLLSDCINKSRKESKISLIENSLEYMKANIYEYSLNISDIASKSGISEDYFRKIFKDLYGITPVKYITDIRLGYAKELLNYTNLNISGISKAAGYENEVYFHRLFKNYFGITPAQYRKKKLSNL